MATAAIVGGDIIVILDQGWHMGLMATQTILIYHSRTVRLMTGETLLVSRMFGVTFGTTELGVKARITLHLLTLLIMTGEADRFDRDAAISNIDLQGVVGMMTTDALSYLVVGLCTGIMALRAEWNSVAPLRRVLKMTIQAGHRRQVLGTVGLDIEHVLLMTFDAIAVQNLVVGLRCIRGPDPAKYQEKRQNHDQQWIKFSRHIFPVPLFLSATVKQLIRSAPCTPDYYNIKRL